MHIFRLSTIHKNIGIQFFQDIQNFDHCHICRMDIKFLMRIPINPLKSIPSKCIFIFRMRNFNFEQFFFFMTNNMRGTPVGKVGIIIISNFRFQLIDLIRTGIAEIIIRIIQITKESMNAFFPITNNDM